MSASTLAGTFDEPAVVENGAEDLGTKGSFEPARCLFLEHLKEVFADGCFEGVAQRIHLVGVKGSQSGNEGAFISAETLGGFADPLNVLGRVIARRGWSGHVGRRRWDG